jgi:hypothetical protein
MELFLLWVLLLGVLGVEAEQEQVLVFHGGYPCWKPGPCCFLQKRTKAKWTL